MVKKQTDSPATGPRPEKPRMAKKGAMIAAGNARSKTCRTQMTAMIGLSAHNFKAVSKRFWISSGRGVPVLSLIPAARSFKASGKMFGMLFIKLAGGVVSM